MNFVGRQPTEAELVDMVSPYGTNHGEQWTAEAIGRCVRIGAEAVSRDPETAEEITQGLLSLRVAGSGSQG